VRPTALPNTTDPVPAFTVNERGVADASLFTVLGYTYGGSGGSFNLPNLTNRFIVGSGTEYSVGNTGGLKEVTLTTAQLPKHSHTITDNGHVHGITDPGHVHGITDSGHSHPINVASVISKDFVIGPTGDLQDRLESASSGNTGSIVTGITINSNSTGITGANSNTTGITGTNIEGGDTAHENRPPYFALIYLIRIQ
jgi:microcystin-dependent protein